MTYLDSRGLPLSAASDVTADLYRQGVDLLLSGWPGAGQMLDSAISGDPDFALAHAARARLHATRAEAEAARTRIAVAREIVARTGTERERSHVEVLALAIAGQSARALQGALAHVETWPRDSIIFSLPLGAFGLFAFSGMADHDQARVDLCERHARHFADDDWWFLTNRGWAHAENGAVGLGRRLAHRAYDLRRENANAVHALSHAMFEDGSGADAEALIDDWLPGYDRSGSLHGHISWHAALIALDDGDAERALAIYTERVRPAASEAAALNVVSDSASLLWRLKAHGHDVPRALWDEAAAYAEGAFPRAAFAFVDVHMALLAAATGNRAAIERRVGDLTVARDGGPAGAMVQAVSRAVLAFADEDYRGAASLLAPVARDVVRMGGSHAQREVVEDTLLVALMRSGETAQAHALLDARLHRRPSPRDTRWRGAVAV